MLLTLTTMFWDGGVPNLEQQVLAPIESHFEMDFNLPDVVTRLNNIEEYKTLSMKAYNQLPSIFSVHAPLLVLKEHSLQVNQSMMIIPTTTIKMHFQHQKKEVWICFLEKKVIAFIVMVHFLFTDNSFQNNGIYEYYADSGRARITLNQDDVGLFKVPSLRNCEKTAPYMHDGSFATLEEVVEHYNSGGKSHRNKSSILRQLNLSAQEKQDLVAFLKALTDEK
jgi:cytochrome c peroxidase